MRIGAIRQGSNERVEVGDRFAEPDAGICGPCRRMHDVRRRPDLSIQPCQLSADNHNPWISTIGAATFVIVSSVERRHDIEGGNAMSDLPDWAQRLDLSPHPEGGWFRETWRSPLAIPNPPCRRITPDHAAPEPPSSSC